MSKNSPNTREEAYAYQFESDVKTLHSMALLSKEAFKKHLAVLQSHIDAYNNQELQKASEESARKYEARKEWVKINYGLE